MKWVNKQKLLAIEAIKYNSQPCLNINDLWQALHLLFNTVLHRSIDISILNEIDSISPLPWNLFSKEEFKIAISSCNNSFFLGPDKLLWSHLKLILQNNECLINIIRITNLCINLGYWPSHFKNQLWLLFPNPIKYPTIILNCLGPSSCSTLLANLLKKSSATDFNSMSHQILSYI